MRAYSELYLFMILFRGCTCTYTIRIVTNIFFRQETKHVLYKLYIALSFEMLFERDVFDAVETAREHYLKYIFNTL